MANDIIRFAKYHGVRSWLIFVLPVLVCGCGQELMALKRLSESQNEIRIDVQRQQEKVKKLFSDIDSLKVKPGILKKDVLRVYGDPVLEENSASGSLLLYRDPVKFSGTRKVYLIFDNDGILSEFKVEQ